MRDDVAKQSRKTSVSRKTSSVVPNQQAVSVSSQLPSVPLSAAILQVLALPQPSFPTTPLQLWKALQPPPPSLEDELADEGLDPDAIPDADARRACQEVLQFLCKQAEVMTKLEPVTPEELDEHIDCFVPALCTVVRWQRHKRSLTEVETRQLEVLRKYCARIASWGRFYREDRERRFRQWYRMSLEEAIKKAKASDDKALVALVRFDKRYIGSEWALGRIAEVQRQRAVVLRTTKATQRKKDLLDQLGDALKSAGRSCYGSTSGGYRDFEEYTRILKLRGLSLGDRKQRNAFRTWLMNDPSFSARGFERLAGDLLERPSDFRKLLKKNRLD